LVSKVILYVMLPMNICIVPAMITVNFFGLPIY